MINIRSIIKAPAYLKTLTKVDNVNLFMEDNDEFTEEIINKIRSAKSIYFMSDCPQLATALTYIAIIENITLYSMENKNNMVVRSWLLNLKKPNKICIPYNASIRQISSFITSEIEDVNTNHKTENFSRIVYDKHSLNNFFSIKSHKNSFNPRSKEYNRTHEDKFLITYICNLKSIPKKIRIYEVGISYYGRTYEEGKKIGWKDGIRAIYCILKYNL